MIGAYLLLLLGDGLSGVSGRHLVHLLSQNFLFLETVMASIDLVFLDSFLTPFLIRKNRLIMHSCLSVYRFRLILFSPFNPLYPFLLFV